MQLGQPRHTIQHLGRNAQPLEVVEDVSLNALQPGLCRPDVVGVNAEGQILGLDKTVVSFRQLVLQHLRVLSPDAVKIVLLRWNRNGAGKGLFGCRQIEEGQLK